jgi:hypothetical protein
MSGACPLIFKGRYVEKVNLDCVRISSCCVNDHHKYTTVDFVNNRHLVTQRNQLTQGQTVPGCHRCDQIESYGHWSLRQSALNDFEQQQIPMDPTVELLSLDYNVDPVCNAKCIHCTDELSSLWAAEEAKFNPKYVSFRPAGQTRKNTPLATVDLSRLRRLYFNGGEPFLSSEPEVILQQIQQQGNLNQLWLIINTNGSIRPTPEQIQLWRECKKVTLNFSIDGTESAFEYIRHPLSWTTIVDNLQHLKSLGLPNLSIGLSFALGIHNIDQLIPTVDWFNKATQGAPAGAGIHVVRGQLSIGTANSELKQYYYNRIPSGNFKGKELLIGQLLEPDSQSNTWLPYLEKLDQRRNLNWRTALPGLAHALEKSQGH